MKPIIKTGKVMPAQLIKTPARSAGFTIIELLVVLLLIALLASIVAPVVEKSILRAKESTLKENLFIVRKSLDDYYADKGRYPEELKVLVEDRYIRHVPDDPVSETTQWQLVFTDGGIDQGRGIIDLHSLSTEISSEGNYYNEW